MISKIYQLQNQIVDQETALRGLMITGVRTFLDPYHRATPEQSMQELESLLEFDQPQLAKAYELRARYEAWLRFAQTAINEGRIAEARELGAMMERKIKMDEVRTTVAALLQN